MASDHRVISIEDFLRTDLEGTVDFATTKVIFEELVESCKASSIDRILLDIRNVSETNIEASDIFSLVMHLLALDLTRDFRMAIVNKPKDDIDRAKIFERCANVHGIKVAAFRDFEDALKWLNDGQL